MMIGVYTNILLKKKERITYNLTKGIYIIYIFRHIQILTNLHFKASVKCI